jgi:alpha-tubulin suppressor-like RCC1 family protein
MRRLGCTPTLPPLRPTRRGGLRPLTRRIAPTLAVLLVAALGCEKDAESPTAPEPGPALATSTTPALAFYQVSAGNDHTCGVTTDNRAFCWGFYGLSGPIALGDGSNTGSLTPVAVAGTLAFRQVTAGYNHTCGVTTDNRAFCWGNNKVGQIGDSTTVYRRVKPTLVARQHQYRLVDAGRNYNCAVTTDDRAFCWGEGRLGQIGNGKLAFYFWPRAVAGGLLFSRVSAGAYHTCGETTTNRAYCWGTGGSGQLGDGTYTANQLTPVAVVGGLAFAQVSAGSFQTCGKTPASVAYCWGSNFYGELGDGTGGLPARSSTPVPVAGPS